MTKERPKHNESRVSNSDIVETLTAISIISRCLARKIIQADLMKGKEKYGTNTAQSESQPEQA